ncbi:hypothetical protein AMB3_2991 [plant metagenome]
MATVAFSINPAPAFEAAVSIPRAGGEPAVITLVFQHKSRADLEAYLLRAGKADADQEGALLTEIVAGWSGVAEPYSEEHLGMLLANYPGAAKAVITAYLEELTQARRKN